MSDDAASPELLGLSDGLSQASYMLSGITNASQVPLATSNGAELSEVIQAKEAVEEGNVTTVVRSLVRSQEVEASARSVASHQLASQEKQSGRTPVTSNSESAALEAEEDKDDSGTGEEKDCEVSQVYSGDERQGAPCSAGPAALDELRDESVEEADIMEHSNEPVSEDTDPSELIGKIRSFSPGEKAGNPIPLFELFRDIREIAFRAMRTEEIAFLLPRDIQALCFERFRQISAIVLQGAGVTETEPWVNVVTELFASFKALLDCTKASSLTRMSTDTGTWREEASNTLSSFVPLVDHLLSRYGQNAELYLAACKGYCSLLEFATGSHESFVLTIAWKQCARLAHSSPEQTSELNLIALNGLSKSYAMHIRTLQDAQTAEMNKCNGLGKWYLTQLGAFLSGGRTLICRQQLPFIIRMLRMTCTLLCQETLRIDPTSEALMSCLIKMLTFLFKSPKVDETMKRLLLEECFESIISPSEPDPMNDADGTTTAGKALLVSLLFRYMAWGTTDEQCAFLLGDTPMSLQAVFGVLSEVDSALLNCSEGSRPSLYAEYLTGICVFTHTLFPEAFAELERILFMEWLRPGSASTGILVGDLLTYIAENGPASVRETWKSQLFPQMIGSLKEFPKLRSRMKSLSGNIFGDYPVDAAALSPATDLDDGWLESVLDHWAGASCVTKELLQSQGTLVLDACDLIFRQVLLRKGDSEYVRWLSALHLVLESMGTLAKSLDTLNGDPEVAKFRPRLVNILRLLPNVIRSTSEPAQVAASATDENTMEKIVDGINRALHLATSAVNHFEPGDIDRLLGTLHGHPLKGYFPETAVLELLAAIGPFSTDETQKYAAIAYKEALESDNWAVVYSALQSLVHFSAASPRGPPKMIAAHKVMVRNFIKKVPFAFDGKMA
ncbi:uncharacterized protein EV422DRAFT_541024 [Fimicolochytrium jonesii]|uniref:uncharacterized protein n=1 Tax=Fimicolochytrium jonesii TaxID=1396493 RepID=UPI0022FE9E61|nr:uncharacterized protein EV422DRAFT_541024 [Fimicolochytrium jonesii]KAI8817527.1 hypothetical protein EV422DRAFT_541024 [Fimicolochytrium jonesii]